MKHEYVAGRAYAMVGASSAHNLITLNLASALHQHLRGKPCKLFASDMTLRIDDAFYYPDLMATCDSSDRNEHFKEHPVLIIEVLSPSTERVDTGDKRIAYPTLASLEEYALIARDRMEIRIFRRSGEGWDLETFFQGDRVRFNSIDLDLPIEEVFEEVWR